MVRCRSVLGSFRNCRALQLNHFIGLIVRSLVTRRMMKSCWLQKLPFANVLHENPYQDVKASIKAKTSKSLYQGIDMKQDPLSRQKQRRKNRPLSRYEHEVIAFIKAKREHYHAREAPWPPPSSSSSSFSSSLDWLGGQAILPVAICVISQSTADNRDMFSGQSNSPDRI